MVDPGIGGDAEGDTYDSIEDVQGSRFSDQIRGNDIANGILGLDGDDHPRGRGGNDYLVGGAGADTLHGGLRADGTRRLREQKTWNRESVPRLNSLWGITKTLDEGVGQ